ncbi:acylphosphatase [Aeropyrum camini SY1 = JCM 12091]|uniref:acylphosphatase n=2 Tax=Aeropyrum camini TaxID=229980 RepID=U3TAA8_9CREN|nr:acylphosphatase [Aeropyrum camini SY1 = JCM 12091]
MAVPSVKDSMVRARIVVRGVVQGVFFRASMREEARRLGLSGWVRNLPDGESVEAVVEGEGEAVERLICWALRGPPAARVKELRVELKPYRGEFRGFEIRY